MHIIKGFFGKSRQQSIGFNPTITNDVLSFANKFEISQTLAIQHLFILGVEESEENFKENELPFLSLENEVLEPRSYKFPFQFLAKLEELSLEKGFRKSITFNQIIRLGIEKHKRGNHGN